MTRRYPVQSNLAQGNNTASRYVTDLSPDRRGVDLTHVAAAVVPTHPAQRHRPRVDVISDHREPRAVRDHLVVQGENPLVL